MGSSVEVQKMQLLGFPLRYTAFAKAPTGPARYLSQSPGPVSEGNSCLGLFLGPVVIFFSLGSLDHLTIDPQTQFLANLEKRHLLGSN